MLLHPTFATFQEHFNTRKVYVSAMSQEQSATTSQSLTRRITPPPRMVSSQPTASRMPLPNHAGSQPAKQPAMTRHIVRPHRKPKAKGPEYYSQPPPSSNLAQQIFPVLASTHNNRPISSSQPTPLTRADTVILSPPRTYPPPRHFSCYDGPPIEPKGPWVETGGDPIVRDFFYENRKVGGGLQKQEAGKTEPIIDPEATYESQASSQQSAPSSQLRRADAMIDVEFFSSQQSQSIPLRGQKTEPVINLDDVYSSQAPPLSSQQDESWDSSQPYPSTPNPTTNLSYVKTPIISPNGTFIYDDDSHRKPLPGKELKFDQVAQKLGQLPDSGLPTVLQPPIQFKPYPAFDSLSPLSSLPSLSSMGSGVMEVEEDEEVPTKPRQRRLSAPCEAMQSLSLINPDAPAAAQTNTSPGPSHGYNLRNTRGLSTPSSPTSSPASSQGRKRKAISSAGRTESTPRTRQRTQVQSSFDRDPLSAPTVFEHTRPQRKRTRDEETINRNTQDLPTTNTTDERITRSRSNKVRKLA